MKTLVLSMLAMASIAAMTSCSNENDPIDEVNPQGGNDKVEIKLTAGVGSITTKAPISSTFADALSVFFFRPEDETIANWSTGKVLTATMSTSNTRWRN